MKPLSFILLFTFLILQAAAQGFQKKYDVVLPDSISAVRSDWADFNNDGVLDILVIATGSQNRYMLMFVQGDTVLGPRLLTTHQPIMVCHAFAIIDYNQDNRMDIILSGNKNGMPATAVYLNKGNFKFEEETLNIPNFSIIRFADLDGDGREEMILSGSDVTHDYTTILQQLPDRSWNVVHDSLTVKSSALEVFDADADGDKDIFISGISTPDTPVTTFLINKGSFHFRPSLTSATAGTASAGDINNDGIFDVVFTGTNENNVRLGNTYLSAGNSFQVVDNFIIASDAHFFVADFNSNGVADINFRGMSLANEPLNIIRYPDYDASLPTDHLVEQHPGDVEHDGDLDILQVTKPDSFHMVIYENKTVQKNNGPGRPFNAIALPVFNRIFAYWEKPSDDHTNVNTLTFDVTLLAQIPLLSGSFDQINGRKMTVCHGNNGTFNFNLWKHVPIGNVDFMVRSVDNAFHTSGENTGICHGRLQPCATYDAVQIKVCTNERISLTADAANENVLWFSFSSRFLGKATEMNVQSAANDTLFSFHPRLIGCDALKIYTLEIDNSDKIETKDRYICEGSNTRFEVEAGWQYTNWSSMLKGDLGKSNPLIYTTAEPDSVSITVTNAQGCEIFRQVAITVSKPIVQAQPDKVKILKGNSVQLSAIGAGRYTWTPATGLDKSDADNPVATPLTSLRYTVTGYDSIGCSDKADVMIIVEGSSFIPNLFTPNDDGTNDELKVLGLPSVKNFLFSLYNREGSLVFKTHDFAEITQRGWDGTTGGVKQPAGIYFWEIEGSTQTGERILLNGKEKGSVFLVR